jgi:acetyltransferase
MTTRNLQDALHPRSVAVIGASEREGSVGKSVTDNILAGGFAGRVYLVNPKRKEIGGVACYPNVASLPEAPDLAVIATPPPTIPELVTALGEKGTRAAVVITAGVDKELRQAMLDAARPYCFRIIGPNCFGISVPGLGLNANFGAVQPRKGNLAFLAQSGALMGAILDWASPRGVGFSVVVSMGDMADVDVGDLLDHLAGDAATRAILMYLETIPDPRKFMSAARSAARVKPVIVVKSGRHAESAKAAATHTGALAGADNVVNAAFKRAGLLRVDDLEELFVAAETLADVRPSPGNELLILTNGGGAGVMAVDTLIGGGGRLAPLTEEIAAKLDGVLPANWSRANPVDIIGDATQDRYAQALEILLQDPQADAILVMNCPTAITSSTEAAKAVVSVVERQRAQGKIPPILTNWLGEASTGEARAAFHAAGIPTYRTPSRAVTGFGYLWQYARAQEDLLRTPPREAGVADIDSEAAQAVLRRAGAAGRAMLTEPEAKAVIAAFGIKTVPTRIAETPEAVEDIAAEILEQSRSVVVKLLAEDVSHKSDVGGVVLRLRTAKEARIAAETIRDRLAEKMPGVAMQGFTVQPMISKPKAHELLLGTVEDPLFGPVILFGAGGTATEVIKDTAIGLPPLDLQLARELMEETRIYNLLKGYRDRPAADLDAIAETLVRLSQLVIDCPAIRELDINPLLANHHGVMALDARIRIEPKDLSVPAPNPRLAIRPYPKEWKSKVKLPQGDDIIVRPIKPADEHLYGEFIAKLDPEDIRLRFLAPQKEFSHNFIARLTQIDYARAMAFVALDPGQEQLLGVARLAADPDYTRAEFAIIVRSDRKGSGIGWALMQQLVAYAKADGLECLEGTVLATNTQMLHLMADLAFEIHPDPEDAAIMQVRLPLREPPPARARLI